MGDKMLYSLIVPIYKVESYLECCVDSIIKQTYKNIEIILVDDGSPDSCPIICEKYKKMDDRIVVIHKENGGLVSARQAGARICSGDYILCVDGDDWIAPNYVEELNEIIEKYNCPLVCCNAYDSYHDKDIPRSFGYKAGFYNKKDIENKILPAAIEGKKGDYFPPSMWAKAIRRDIYMQEQLAVPVSITIGEDGACTKPILYKVESLYISDKCLYHYRNNESSMTKVKRVYDWDDTIVLVEHLKKRISIDSSEIEKQYARLLTIWAFKTAISRFYSDDSYKNVVRNISNHISSGQYREAALNCDLKGFKGKLIKFFVKNKFYFGFYIFSKIY